MARAKRKTQTVYQCETDGCENDAAYAGLCKACYSYEWYWTRNKTPAERRARAKKLKLFEARMDAIAERPPMRRIK